MMVFNTLYQELANGLELFSALLAGITQAEAEIRPFPESWSILEVVCHLYDEEREDFRARLKKILNEDHDWDPIDPSGWVVSRNYMKNNYDEVLKNFLAERKNSIEWLKNLDVKDWNVEAVHPKFGSFSAIQMLSNWLAHDYLHFRQILKIKYEYLNKNSKQDSLGYAGDW